MQGVLLAIEQAGPTRWLATAFAAYPVVSALHILGIALLLGPILTLDWALLRGRAPIAGLRRVAIGGFALAATAGALLFATQASKYAANPAFLLKLGLIGLAGANALAFALLGAAHARPFALASVTLWLSVLLAGRFIAFV